MFPAVSLSPVFLCSAPSSRCINPHTLLRSPPLPRATLLLHPTTTHASHSAILSTYQHPPPHFPHRLPPASIRSSAPTPATVQPSLPRTTLLPHPTTTPAASQRNPLHTYTRRSSFAQATTHQHQEQHAHSHHCTATTPPHQSSQQIGAPALATTIQLPPPHTQASKKDCPAQEQSFL